LLLKNNIGLAHITMSPGLRSWCFKIIFKFLYWKP